MGSTSRPRSLFASLLYLALPTALFALNSCPEGFNVHFEDDFTSYAVGETPGAPWITPATIFESDLLPDFHWMGEYSTGGPALAFNDLPPHDAISVQFDAVTNGLMTIEQNGVAMIVDVGLNALSNPADFGREHWVAATVGRECDPPGDTSCYTQLTELSISYEPNAFIAGTEIGSVQESPGFQAVYSGPDAAGCPSYCAVGDGQSWKTSVASLVHPPMAHNATSLTLAWTDDLNLYDTGMSWGIGGVRVCLREPVEPIKIDDVDDWYSVEVLDTETGTDYPLTTPLSSWNSFGSLGEYLSGHFSSLDTAARDLPFAFPFFCTEYETYWLNFDNFLSFEPNLEFDIPSTIVGRVPNSLSYLWSDFEYDSTVSTSWYARQEGDQYHLMGRNLDVAGITSTTDQITVGYTLHRDGTIDMHWIESSHETFNFPANSQGGFLSGPYNFTQDVYPGTVPLSKPDDGTAFRFKPNYRCSNLEEGSDDESSFPLGIILGIVGVLAVVAAGAAVVLYRSRSLSSPGVQKSSGTNKTPATSKKSAISRHLNAGAGDGGAAEQAKKRRRSLETAGVSVVLDRIQRDDSPTKKDASPAKKDSSPTKKDGSPLKGEGSPLKARGSPTKHRGSSPTKGRSRSGSGGGGKRRRSSAAGKRRGSKAKKDKKDLGTAADVEVAW